MPDPVGLFEMRRLEQLSNTIFGVAMTLLAYDLPKLGGLKGPPSWTDIWHAYTAQVAALILSFIIAGMFWLSHHRRLAMAPHAGRGVVFLNLLFLLSIVILPATNGLYGSYRTTALVAVIYGAHLTIIAFLNAVLWVIVLRGRGNGELIAPALFPVAVFVVGTAVASVAPTVGPFLWFTAFAAPLMGWLAGRRRAAVAQEPIPPA